MPLPLQYPYSSGSWGSRRPHGCRVTVCYGWHRDELRRRHCGPHWNALVSMTPRTRVFNMATSTILVVRVRTELLTFALWTKSAMFFLSCPRNEDAEGEIKDLKDFLAGVWFRNGMERDWKNKVNESEQIWDLVRREGIIVELRCMKNPCILIEWMISSRGKSP